ncbi:MAG: zinc ribbon domain-containing protein [Pygmaiobacter sp.]
MAEFDRWVEKGRALASRAADTAEDLVAKGKDKIDRLALENQLAKAQRQLGALVYSLKKSGEENEELVEHYVEVIAAVEAKLNECEVQEADKYCVSICPSCGVEVPTDAGFCPRCGTKLE